MQGRVHESAIPQVMRHITLRFDVCHLAIISFGGLGNLRPQAVS